MAYDTRFDAFNCGCTKYGAALFVWSKITSEVCKSAFKNYKWYKAPIAAAYFATYMTGFRIVRSISELVVVR